MPVCVPTQQRKAALATGVALALRSADVTTSQKTLPNATDHDEPSSDAEHATDEASEPQPGGHLKSTTNKRKRGDDEPRPEEEERPVHVAAWQVSRSGAESTPSSLLGHDGGPSSEDAESTLSTSLTLVDHDEHHGNPASSATAVSDGQGREPMGPNPDEGATSDLGDDWDARSTVSIDSAIRKYQEEGGREFLDNGSWYWMPIDQKQSEVLDTFHEALLRYSNGQLCVSPVHNVQRVLDIGTGTGKWALDFADEYPGVGVIGIDISPFLPELAAPNLEFQVDDCNEEPTFGENWFGLIHVRNLAGCIEDCESFAKRQFHILKPGGYLEYKDFSMSIQCDDENHKNDSSLTELKELLKEVGCKLKKRSLTIAEDGTMAKAMTQAGFTNVETIEHKMPLGDWRETEELRDIGQLHLYALNYDIEGLVLRPCRLLGWSDEKITVFVSRVRRDLKVMPRLWRKLTTIYGRKPE